MPAPGKSPVFSSGSQQVSDRESRPGDTALVDTLEYMADMMMELQAMAERAHCRTLAGLLKVAHSETLIRRSEIAEVQKRGAA